MLPVRSVARSTRDTLDTGSTAWGLGIPPRVLLVLFLLGLAAVRLSLAVLHPTFMGVDGGAYLLGMFQYIGGPEQTGIERPPLAPGFLLVPTTWLFGVTPLGFNLYAALGSLAIFPPFYLLARRVLGPTWAVLAVVALSLDWEQWVLLVTGVVPVLGFGGICLALWAMVGMAEDDKRDDVDAIGSQWVHGIVLLFSIPLIALSSQTSAALALVSLGVAWVVLPGKARTGFVLGLGGLTAIGMAWPWYEGVLPGSDQVAYQGPLFFLPGIGESRWYQACIVLGFLAWGWWKVKGEKPPAIRALTALIVAHSLLSLVWSSDEAVMNLLFRSGIWQSVPFWIVAVWFVREAFQGRSWLPWALGVGVCMAAIGTAYIWSHQPARSMHMSPDVLAATRALDLGDVERIGSNGESRANWDCGGDWQARRLGAARLTIPALRGGGENGALRPGLAFRLRDGIREPLDNRQNGHGDTDQDKHRAEPVCALVSDRRERALVGAGVEAGECGGLGEPHPGGVAYLHR